MDDELIERLFDNPASAADEAPELAMLLAAASTYPSALGSVSGEDAALAAFRAGPVATPSRRKRMLGKALAAKTLAMLGAGTLVLGGGVAAAAAADTLPTPAQNAISGAASHVGLDFPSHAKGSHHGWGSTNNPHNPGSTSDEQQSGTAGQDQSGEHPDNHGGAVSKVATNPDATGGTNDNHGGAVSETARDNHGQQQSSQSSTKGSDDSTEHATDGQQKAGDAQQKGDDNKPATPDSQGASHAPTP